MTTRNVMHKGFALSGLCAAVLGAGLHAQVANAHGHTTEPPSRAYLCQLGKNTGCGGAASEPQSVSEVAKGFPAGGPVDGKIASGGKRPDFALLDEQSANRWHLTPITDRNIAFDWFYTEGHPTTKWEYFITKNGWNPNAPLSRSAFELTPFCEADGHGKPARGQGNPTHGPAIEKHQCTLPADRSGHHVILGVWTVADTGNAFHNVMDVDIQLDGGPAPEWPRIADIKPVFDMKVGEKMIARAFQGTTENKEYSVGITVDTPEEGKAGNWTYKLAKRINETQTLVRAGKLDADGTIEPVPGVNTIFAKPETGITNYFFALEAAPGEDHYMKLNGLQPEYTLKDGKTSLKFNVITSVNELKVKAQLLDESNKPVGVAEGKATGGAGAIVLDASSQEGTHTLKVVGTDAHKRVLLQETYSVQLKAAGAVEYDFEYPQSIGSYQEGTKVLQPKTGDVFECKPFPYSGWCNNPSAIHYEPGFGSNWADAWNKL